MEEDINIGYLRITQEDKGFLEHKTYIPRYVAALNNA